MCIRYLKFEASYALSWTRRIKAATLASGLPHSISCLHWLAFACKRFSIVANFSSFKICISDRMFRTVQCCLSNYVFVTGARDSQNLLVSIAFNWSQGQDLKASGILSKVSFMAANIIPWPMHWSRFRFPGYWPRPCRFIAIRAVIFTWENKILRFSSCVDWSGSPSIALTTTLIE